MKYLLISQDESLKICLKDCLMRLGALHKYIGDKNKSKLAKKVAKENVSGTTSLSNNAIQTAKDLPDENKQKKNKKKNNDTRF